jgi:hypothetical protein
MGTAEANVTCTPVIVMTSQVPTNDGNGSGTFEPIGLFSAWIRLDFSSSAGRI